MRFKHDPLRPQPRRKKKNETPDETERRLSADLRLLMTDDRYQKNDPDYRHFVQRQYRRVYDDPSGEPREGLRIGRPEVFVTDLEPFDRDRERRIRRGEEVEGISPQIRRSTSARHEAALGQANAGSDKSQVNDDSSSESEIGIIPPWERAMTDPEIGERARPTPTPGIAGVENEEARRRYQERLEKRKQREEEIATARWRSRRFLEMADFNGFDEAKRAHEHYLEGSGEPLIIDSEIVRDYEPVIEAEQVIRQHLTNWLRGELIDSRFGRPWLSLGDGQRIVIGEEAFDADRVGKLVHWEATFKGSMNPMASEFWTDARMTFSSGTLESFSQLVLERHGGRIEVSGFVKLRVADRYDFGENHILKSGDLEKHGEAKSFDVSTTIWTRPISGWIELGGSRPPRVQLNYDD